MIPGGSDNDTQANSGDIRVLKVALPRRVTALHQIEITSRCNLRCVYCPSRLMPKVTWLKEPGDFGNHALTGGERGHRPQVDMSEEHFELALRHVEYHVRAGTQEYLNLAGIGESTLHPKFLDFVSEARSRVDAATRPGVRRVAFVMATNGVGYDEELADRLVAIDRQINIFVSVHRPELAAHAVEWFKKRGVLAGVSGDPSVNPNDWGGQVDWIVGSSTMPCMWLRTGLYTALADGRLSACCLDSTGEGMIGHVSDDPSNLRTNPWKLCTDCHQEVAIEGYDQRKYTSPERLVKLGRKRQ